MPRFNIYELKYRGGLAPGEKGEKEEKITKNEVKYDTERTRRQLSFEFANDPYRFANGMLLDLTRKVDELNDYIDALGEDVSVDILELRDEYEDEISKYVDFIDAFDNKDFERLSQYGIVYSPSAYGKTNSLKIIRKGEQAEKAKPVDVEILPPPKGEKNKNYVIQKYTGLGVRLYFETGGLIKGDRVKLGDGEFDYDGNQFIMKSKTFNIESIMHSATHPYRVGDFVKDSKGRIFYVNPDRTLAEVRGNLAEELKNKPEKIYNLTPRQEENILPKAIVPSFIEEYKNRIREETEIPFSERLINVGIESLKDLWKGAKERAERYRERLELRGRIKRPPSPLLPETKWGLEGLSETPMIEEAKRGLKKIVSE